MQRFDRYMLSQLFMLFGFFALVLISVYWINQAVKLFDRLVADGHSIGVFLEFTALALPAVIVLVLPMSAFAATVYVMNRLSADSELTVVQATGYSPYRLARPVILFGICVALFMSALTLYLVPRAKAELQTRERAISASVSARVLREGMFLNPSKGLTVFIRDIAEDSTLRDVFIHDARREDSQTSFSSKSGRIVVDQVGPKIVLLNGLSQTYSSQDQRMTTSYFDAFTYDITDMVSPRGNNKRKLSHVKTGEFLTNLAGIQAEFPRATLGKINEEFHMRFQQPLLCLLAALIGYSAMISGNFSRFGATRQIVFAIFLLVGVKFVESFVKSPVRADAALWPLVYLPSLVGLCIAGSLLVKAAKPFSHLKSSQVPG